MEAYTKARKVNMVPLFCYSALSCYKIEMGNFKNCSKKFEKYFDVEYAFFACLTKEKKILYSELAMLERDRGQFHFEMLVKDIRKARMFAFFHNHPSGSENPSETDEKTFEKISKDVYPADCFFGILGENDGVSWYKISDAPQKYLYDFDF